MSQKEQRSLLVQLHQNLRKKTVNEIQQSGGEAFARAVDIANKNDVLAMYEKIFNKYDHLYIVVNNTGISMTKSTIELTEDD